MSQNKQTVRFTLEPLAKPLAWPDGNARLLGQPDNVDFIEPVDKLRLFDDRKFEIFVQQWAEGYLKDQYVSIERRGGANDKGRDIIAWIDKEDTQPRRYDNYQCKHYKDALMPSNFWPELMKLCYYTYNKDIPTPRHYIIATSKGVGTSLVDLITESKKLKEELIEYWNKSKDNSVGKDIPSTLSGDLLDYVKTFDFQIIKILSPEELIKQHECTRYHAFVFGVTVRKRKKMLPPTEIDTKKESKYIELALETYAQCLGTQNCTISDLDQAANEKYKINLNKTREHFYSAESLKEFTRDNFNEESPFDELLDQFEDGLYSTHAQDFTNGFSRMLAVCSMAAKLEISTSILKNELTQADRGGMSHHLANTGKIKSWLS